MCSQSISAVAAVLAETRRDLQKTFLERVDARAKHKQAEKNVENLSIVEGKSKHEDVRRQLLPKSRQHFRLRMHGEIAVVHSNVNVSTPRLVSFILCRSDVVY